MVRVIQTGLLTCGDVRAHMRAGCRRWSFEDDALRPSQATQYTGWEATEAAIQQALVDYAPIDGLLGFSQGASCAAVYAVKAERSASLHKPQFVVFISGFLPKDHTWADEMLATGIRTPTLHLFGEEDKIIPIEKSERLVTICSAEHAAVLPHPGGHFVPTCNAKVREPVRKFFREQMQKLDWQEPEPPMDSSSVLQSNSRASTGPVVIEQAHKIAQRA
jgi:predicted esterase